MYNFYKQKDEDVTHKQKKFILKVCKEAKLASVFERSHDLMVEWMFPELDFATLPAEVAVVVGGALEALDLAQLLQAPVVSLVVEGNCFLHFKVEAI